MTNQTAGQLRATPRSVVGKKVRFVRRQGLTPGNVYGHNLESKAIQLNAEELTHTLRRVPRSQLMTLTVEGESSPRPVLIRHLHRHPVRNEILHVDFYQVSMTERMRTEVPIHVVGSTPAIDDLNGLLVQELNSIEIECLPGNIPSAIEVDISKIEAIGDSLHIRDLVSPANVTLHGDEDAVVVRVASSFMSEESDASGASEDAGATE